MLLGPGFFISALQNVRGHVKSKFYGNSYWDIDMLNILYNVIIKDVHSKGMYICVCIMCTYMYNMDKYAYIETV